MHILYTNYPKIKQSRKEVEKTIPFTIASKAIEFLRNKFNQGGEIPLLWKLQDTDETNQRWHKHMEIYTKFLDWKNQHC